MSRTEDERNFETYLHLKFDWIGYHRWPGAPDAEDFLRQIHRHKFFAEVTLQTFHNDRELEFFAVLKKLHSTIEGLTAILRSGPSWSVEMMAEQIANKLLDEYGEHRRCEVRVFEDNENGGEVIWIPEKMYWRRRNG